MEKLCIFCVHAGFSDAGHGIYADPAQFECHKGLLPARDSFENGHYRAVYNIDNWREIIITAQTCPEYKQVDP